MARKLTALWLGLALALPLAACGDAGQEEYVDTPPAVEEEARDRGNAY